jgi:hypothetical protein
MRSRRREYLMKEFLMDMFRQVFGVQKPRAGKIILTRYTYQKMREYQLDTDTLEDTFRYGEEVNEGKIVRKYANYSVGMFYKLEETQFHKNIKPEEQYVIITCWKGGGL